MHPRDIYRKRFKEKKIFTLENVVFSNHYVEWLENYIQKMEGNCCPKCGEQEDVIWTCYCNKCKEAL